MSKKKNDIPQEEKEEITQDSKSTEEINEEENPLEKELEETKHQLLVVSSEYANFRKRTEKEKSESFAFATAKAITEILSVVDNMERALSDEHKDYDTLRKGLEMTYSGFISSLERLGVTSFGNEGDTFDPNLHKAVHHIEDENLDANVVTAVAKKGYKLNDKVIRIAEVVTAN